MRYGWLIVVLMLAACQGKKPCPEVAAVETCDSAKRELAIVINQWAELQRETDSLKAVNDTLRSKLFLANYKVEKVGFYLDIVDRKRSQEKFLRGWIRRAIE